MNTQISGSKEAVGLTETRQDLIQKILLWCGILYLPLYVASHILAGLIWEGYSQLDQQVIELTAIGSPARQLLTAFQPVLTVLVIAFAIGIWLSAGKKRSLKVAAVAMIIFGVIGFSGWFAPMNPPGAERSATDIFHLVSIFLTVLSMLLFVGFGSGADGIWFRIYSILTMGVTLVAGAYTGTQAAKIAAGLPTPGLGAIERLSVYLPLLWMMMLAIVLLRDQPEQTKT